jgi:hypothetical protein
VIGLDAAAGKLERIKSIAAARRNRGVHLVRGHLHSDPVEIELVVFEGVLLDGRVAAICDIVDDGADGGFDVGRRLAFGAEECTKLLGKIGRANIEVDCHGPELNCAWRQRQPFFSAGAVSSSPP